VTVTPETTRRIGGHRVARTPPSGPAYVEIPVDLLTAPVSDTPVTGLDGSPVLRAAEPDAVRGAATLIDAAERPVIWAGGGVLRSGAQTELQALAERLDAPVATTYMGKGALPDDHPLAAGCGCDEAAFQEPLSEAEVVLCVGTELGAETTGQYALRFGGQVIHLDAAPARAGATYPALPLVGDARLTLRALLAEVASHPAGDASDRVRSLRQRIRAGLQAQERDTELGLLAAIEAALGPDAIGTWDMTILGYWAAPHLAMRAGQQFLYPLGSGTLGYAWSAALGASIAHPDRDVLAVVGDGGLQYALAELGTAAQHKLPAKLLIIDDGGYGILREYQRDAFAETTAVDLPGTDLAAVVSGFGVPVHGIQGLTLALVSAFIDVGDTVIIPRPTYGLYAQACEAAGAAVVRVDNAPSLALDLPAIAAAAADHHAKLAWVCDPNNPTGLRLEQAEWDAFLDALPPGCIAIADEAYRDYIDPEQRVDRLADIRAGRPVIVLRTFSKIFGLAGLRLGYMFVDASLAQLIDSVLEPFNVNRAALSAGLASLRRTELLPARREEVKRARARLAAALGHSQVRALPSAANFVLLELGDDDLRVGDALAREGMLVRPGSEFGLAGFARVTTGEEALMETVGEHIAAIVGRGRSA
jgi:histidinol-phosphate/aromatic aminotransferase/cobyric acid decarboxylase-like protein